MTTAQKLLLLTPGLTPQTRAWRDAIFAGGETVDQDIVMKVDRYLTRPLLGYGLWDKSLMIDPCVGNGIQASLYRLKTPLTIDRKATTGGFTNSDYNQTGANGGRTGNGTSKYIDTLINPSALGFSVSSFMMWAYTRTAVVGTGTSRISIGNSGVSGGSITTLGWIQSGTKESLGVAASTGTEYTAGSATSITGFLGGGVSSGRTQQLYQNGASVGASSTASGTFSNVNIYAHATNNNGVTGSYNNRTISSMWLTQGLSAAEIVTFNSIVQAFETALGRNV